jgi:hypothetical protein
MSVESLGMVIGALGIAVAFWAIYWDHHNKRLQFEERRLMIERGMTPPTLTGEADQESLATPEDCLRRGLIMVFVGVGLGIAYFVVHASRPPSPPAWLFGAGGAIVGLLGLGNLVYYVIARARTAR